MIYCLDANALIEPWSKYYSPELCPDYWDALSELAEKRIIFCTDEVRREVVKVDDGLSAWVKARPDFVREVDDDVQTKLRVILQRFQRLVDTIKDRSMADPWVIAHAWSVGATVVTKEIRTDSAKRIRIPDVCHALNVPCIDDFEFLKQVGIRFRVQQQ